MNYVSATSRGLDPVARARELGPLIAEAADQIERDQQIPAAAAGEDHRSETAPNAAAALGGRR